MKSLSELLEGEVPPSQAAAFKRLEESGLAAFLDGNDAGITDLRRAMNLCEEWVKKEGKAYYAYLISFQYHASEQYWKNHSYFLPYDLICLDFIVYLDMMIRDCESFELKNGNKQRLLYVECGKLSEKNEFKLLRWLDKHRDIERLTIN